MKLISVLALKKEKNGFPQSASSATRECGEHTGLGAVRGALREDCSSKRWLVQLRTFSAATQEGLRSDVSPTARCALRVTDCSVIVISLQRAEVSFCFGFLLVLFFFSVSHVL